MSLKGSMLLLCLSFLNTLLTPSVSLACSVCFYGTSDDPMNFALKMGIVSLLLILIVIMGLFIKFFLSIRNRSKLPAHNK